MTTRFSLFLVVMTIAVLSCSVSVPVMTTIPAPTAVMTARAKPVMTTVQKALATATVTAVESLHIRADASEKSIVVGYLYNGDQVILTGKCSGGWAQILVADSGYAWVKARYLSDNKCKE